MGHWSESLVDEAAARLGGDIDREELLRYLRMAADEIEVLAGRSFRSLHQATVQIETNGLPFADIPDLRINGTFESTASVYPIADAVQPDLAAILQVSLREEALPRAVSVGTALFIAGQLVAGIAKQGYLSAEYMRYWLAQAAQGADRVELLRRLLNQQLRFYVPIFGGEVEGWWLQIARRLFWLTDESEDDGRLVQPILDESQIQTSAAGILSASEPVLVAARLTSQPSDWAFAARLWTDEVRRLPLGVTWLKTARAIHGHGIPVVTVDPGSTAYEVGCQLLLKGYWHGYVPSNEPLLAKSVALAFPRQVERVRRGTRAADSESAAAVLLEGLIYPGFDPNRGAAANRRYVSRKANIAVMNHRKQEFVDRQPWTILGISERRYYKLLPRFAEKVSGRYLVDEHILEQMRRHLDGREHERSVSALARDVLRRRGFSEVAARKWLQRHPLEDAAHARPRTPVTNRPA